MAAVMLLLGACATVTGVALLCWPAAVSVAGVLLMLAAIDLRR